MHKSRTMFLLWLCALPAVFGQTAPPRCCRERQFEAKLGETGGALYSVHGVEVPGIVDAENIFHYDYYNKTSVMEVKERNTDGSITATTIIYDQKTRRQYVIGSGYCTVSTTLGVFNDPCIPANAIFQGVSYLGYGRNSIRYELWQYTEPSDGNTIRLTVTQTTCIPIVQSTLGVVNGAPSDISFVITNFSPGIKDKSIFKLPDICTGGTNMNDDITIHPPHIRRAIIAMRALS